MIKETKQYFCDICKKEFKKESDLKYNCKISVLTDCNWTDGHPEKPHIEIITKDLCDECLLKSTNLKCGFRETEIEFIHKGELNK